jgi:TonB family protein
MTKPRLSFLDDDRLRGLVAALASIAIHAILIGLLSLRIPSFAVRGDAEAPTLFVSLQEGDGGEPATAAPGASAKVAVVQESKAVASPEVGEEAPHVAPPQEAAKDSDGDQGGEPSQGGAATATNTGLSGFQGGVSGASGSEDAGTGYGGTGEGTNDVLGADPAAAFVARVGAALQARKTYPEAARRRGAEGVVRLRLRVSEDGHLVSATIASSSGSGLLDHAALALASSVFPQENQSQRELTFVLAVKYSLGQATVGK